MKLAISVPRETPVAGGGDIENSFPRGLHLQEAVTVTSKILEFLKCFVAFYSVAPNVSFVGGVAIFVIVPLGDNVEETVDVAYSLVHSGLILHHIVFARRQAVGGDARIHIYSLVSLVPSVCILMTVDGLESVYIRH